MDTAEIIVTIAGALLVVGILWFFFGPRAAATAKQDSGGVQRIDVLVQGGYTPDRIEVVAGRPVQLNFMRRETNPCSEQVILPDFGIVQNLPMDQSTPVILTPKRPGEYPFHCAMNMLRGRLIVKPA
jgi:plastocyanin domain-containing protein